MPKFCTKNLQIIYFNEMMFHMGERGRIFRANCFNSAASVAPEECLCLPSVSGCERCYLGRVCRFPVGVSRCRERSAVPSSYLSQQVMEHCSARYSSGCCADKLIPSMIRLSITGTTAEGTTRDSLSSLTLAGTLNFNFTFITKMHSITKISLI